MRGGRRGGEEEERGVTAEEDGGGGARGGGEEHRRRLEHGWGRRKEDRARRSAEQETEQETRTGAGSVGGSDGLRPEPVPIRSWEGANAVLQGLYYLTERKPATASAIFETRTANQPRDMNVKNENLPYYLVCLQAGMPTRLYYYEGAKPRGQFPGYLQTSILHRTIPANTSCCINANYL